jgi:hypothetical protein
MLRHTLTQLEAELEDSETRLRQEVADVEALERLGLRSLRARVRGKLPDLLEKERQEVVVALEEREALLQRLEVSRQQRDELENQLTTLREQEAGFGEEAVARARERLEHSSSRDDKEALRRAGDHVILLRHDLADIEEAAAAMSRVSRSLEEAHDAMGAIEPPTFLQVISGMALLDLFETEEIQTAREALMVAKDAGQLADRALRSLETVEPPRAALEALTALHDSSFLARLYHEGKIGKVLRGARSKVEELRDRLWDARTLTRALEEQLVVSLDEAEEGEADAEAPG